MSAIDTTRPAATSLERSLASTLRTQWLSTLPYLLLVALAVVYATKVPAALTLPSISIIVASGLGLAIVAAAQTIVIMTGGIDLSVGGIVSVATVLVATRMGEGVDSIVLWGALILVLGGAAGVLNGALIVWLRLQPFIATLATWSLWWGVALWIQPVQGGTVPTRLVEWTNLSPFEIGAPILILAGGLVLWGIARRSRVIYSIRAVGSAPEAARLAGAHVGRTLMVAYGISGVLAAFAGIFVSTQISSGSPNIGNDLILQSVAAVVIGGASLLGGRGSIAASVAAAYVLTLIDPVVRALGFSSQLVAVVQALVLVLAILIVARGSLAARRRAGEIE